MRFEIHHYHHYPGDDVLKTLEFIMSALDDLKAAVSKNTDAETSVVTLLNGIAQQLKDALAANDPAAVQSVIDQINANTTSAAAAVVANTPAAKPAV
jgi:molecular chaperone GrpE (heat shock protein)